MKEKKVEWHLVFASVFLAISMFILKNYL